MAGACIVVVAVLSGASAGRGGPTQIACFGLAATIVGTEGRDELVGTPRNDVIVGLGGEDFIVGLEGNDAICGGSGGDSYLPGPGDDRVDGGGGGRGVGFIELVAFDLSPAPVRADLSAGVATGEGSDTLVNITALSGSVFADTLVGDAGVNSFFPGAGDDTIDGAGGDDLVGFGRAVTANLVTGSATGEGTDRLVSIEMLIGSDFDDMLIGNTAGNYIAGDRGNDVIQGGSGNDRLYGDEGDDRVLGEGGDDGTTGNDGKDRLLGGAGNDTLSGGMGDDMIDGAGGNDVVTYLRGATSIQANLLVGRVTGQGLDTLAAAENVEGSQFGDQILGDLRANFLSGNSGSDLITAGAGADFLDGGAGGGVLSDGAGRDYCLQGAGSRRCEISGVPGPAPPIMDEPPRSRAAALESVGSSRTGIVMPLPTGQRATWIDLRAVRARMMRVFSGGEGLSRVPPLRWRFDSPLLHRFAWGTTAGAGSFRYVGQPTCYAARKPYRTTVAPPDELQPAVADGVREKVFWRGVLFQRDRRTGKLERTKATPWVTAVVQGPGVPTGFPRWTNTDETSFVSSFSFNLPAGTYAWRHKIKWDRNNAKDEDFIEPHIVQTPKVQPDKACTFGG